MGELMSSSRKMFADGIAYDEGLTDYANKYKKTLQCEVLQNVKQEISTIPLTDGDGHNGHWFRAPQAIIDDVNVIIDKFINEVEQ